ncbi:MAG: hypothetical protein Sapg2KO_44440 [Saprospiraceae bacterium]
MQQSPYYLILILTLLFVSCQAPESESTLSEKSSDYAVLVTEHPDRQAVESAILNYVESLYLVDSSRVTRSVHPELRKRGYWYNEAEGKYYDNLDMTFEELRQLAATWNKDGDQANGQTIKQIDIYDINDRTASAKLTAAWGIDYFHLAKLEDRWYIMNVLWQSIPESE